MDFQISPQEGQVSPRQITLLEEVVSLFFRSLPLRHGPHRLIDRIVPKGWVKGTSLVSVPFRGQRVLIDVSDLVGWHFLLMRSFDPEVAETLLRFSCGGDVFWDIGANKGVLSYAIAVDLPDCRIVAIEPQSAMVAPLNVNLATLAPGRHEVFNVGVGEAAGTFDLVVPLGNRGKASLRAEKLAGSLVERIEVVPADMVRNRSQFGWPTLVKIDVEGFEMPVLRSLHAAFESRSIRCCVFECHADQSDGFREIRQSLSASGYVLYALRKTPFRTRLLAASSPAQGCTDYAAVRADLAP